MSAAVAAALLLASLSSPPAELPGVEAVVQHQAVDQLLQEPPARQPDLVLTPALAINNKSIVWLDVQSDSTDKYTAATINLSVLF